MKRWAIQVICVSLLLFATARASTPYRVILLCGNAECSFPVHAEMYPYARLLTHVTRVRLAFDPAPLTMPSVTWHVSNPSVVTVTATHPFETTLRLPGDTAATPAPQPTEVYLMPGRFERRSRVIGGGGPAIVTADIGPPVNERASFPVFAYGSVLVGCYFNSANGVSLDNNAVNLPPSRADMYVTGPTRGREPFGDCAPQYAGASSYTLHTPHGATIIPTSDFASVKPSQWRDDFREKPLPLGRGVLLVKTGSGTIVKIQALDEQASIDGSAMRSHDGRFADNGIHGSMTVVALPGSASHGHLDASIEYADPMTATYGSPHTIVAEAPWPMKLPFFQSRSVIRVAVSPQPYVQPDVRWSMHGKSATVDARGAVSGVSAGRSTVIAKVGYPVTRTLKLPVTTYDPLVVWCGVGFHFDRHTARQTMSIAASDVYISARADAFDCRGTPRVFFPGGGVMLVNGGDMPQFPEITGAQWRNDMQYLDINRYRALTDPCMVPEGQSNIFRADPGCTKRDAKILLFRTRDGRYVKWMLEAGNGLSTLAGPYEVL